MEPKKKEQHNNLLINYDVCNATKRQPRISKDMITKSIIHLQKYHLQVKKVLLHVRVSPSFVTFKDIQTRKYNRLDTLENDSAIQHRKGNVRDASDSDVDGSNTDEVLKIKVWEIPPGKGVYDTKDYLKKGTLYEYLHSIKGIAHYDENHEWKKITFPNIDHNDNQCDNVTMKDKADTMSNKIYDQTIKHFLPNNYPRSVEKGYAQFITYCFLGNIFSSAAMVLSTQTLLLAVGVGSASASPMAGALNWVMKDGIGQLGGILFASRITSTASSTSSKYHNTSNTIDKDPKRWRMVSSIAMDSSTFLEILTPLFPGYFLSIASIANVGKNIGFLTASASRVSLHQALAISNNLGDVTAKAGSQSIAASLLGTGLGIGLTPVLGGGDTVSIMIGFICLSSMHQYCTYESLYYVALKSCNLHRLHVIMDQYFEYYHSMMNKDEIEMDKKDQIARLNDLLSPQSISKYEDFIPMCHPDDTHTWLEIGCRLLDVSPNPHELHHISNICLKNKEKYIINCDMGSESEQVVMKKVKLTFHYDATDETIIRGLFHAYAMKDVLRSKYQGTLSNVCDESMTGFDKRMYFISKTHDFVEMNFILFYSALMNGNWDLKDVNIEPVNGRRIRIEQN